MTLVLDARHAAAIGRHGEADYPAEACGLIGGTIEDDRKVAVQLVPLANRRTDSARNRYLIDPDSAHSAAWRWLASTIPIPITRRRHRRSTGSTPGRGCPTPS